MAEGKQYAVDAAYMNQWVADKLNECEEDTLAEVCSRLLDPMVDLSFVPCSILDVLFSAAPAMCWSLRCCSSTLWVCTGQPSLFLFNSTRARSCQLGCEPW